MSAKSSNVADTLKISMRAQRVLREAHVVAKSLAEEELVAIFRAMLTISDLGMLITDTEHRSLACNARFGEIFGLDTDRLPSMEVEELRGYVYPRLADREGWLSQLDEAYAKPECRLEDDLVLLEPFQVLHRITGPVRNKAGEIVGRIWTFEDVTRHAVKQRRRDVLVEASIFHDPDPAQVCRYVVERVAEEYDATVLLSIRDGDRMVFREVAKPPAGTEGITENRLEESYCRLALTTIQPVVVQDALKHPEFCEILPARIGLRRCITVPICTMHGKPIGTLCFMDGRVDIPLTQDDVEFMTVLANRLATELERERLYEARTMGQRAAFEEQSMELQAIRSNLASTSEELQRAERTLIQAEKLSVAGTLSAGIAHDIRNIMASLSLICSHPGYADTEKLRLVKTQIDRFGVLSHRLLSYVRPRAISHEPVDLGQIACQAIELLTPQASISGVELVAKIGYIGPVMADASRVEHLIVNLILNSLQAMRSSDGLVRLSTEKTERGGCICIEDNGCGIPAHMLDRIFEPFVSTRGDGFGLGLYSCRQIVEEHGWEIKVDSKTGSGTLIRIDIVAGG